MTEEVGMTEKKEYCLGNQPEKYEVVECFQGWVPANKSWKDLYLGHTVNVELTIVNPVDESSEQPLFLHRFVLKGVFPLSFFGEERAKNWKIFAIVSNTQKSGQFIIPVL